MNKPAVRTTEGSDSFNYGVDWLMAVLLLAAAGGAVWMMRSRLVVDWNSPDFNPLLVIPLILALIGLWSLQKAGRGSLRGRKFGTSTLETERDEVHLGEKLKGAIRTASTLKPDGDWSLTLRCIEQIEERELTNPTKSRTTDH